MNAKSVGIEDLSGLEEAEQPTVYKRRLMNADEGAYQLCHLYDQLIERASSDDDVKTKSRSAITTV